MTPVGMVNVRPTTWSGDPTPDENGAHVGKQAGECGNSGAAESAV